MFRIQGLCGVSHDRVPIGTLEIYGGHWGIAGSLSSTLHGEMEGLLCAVYRAASNCAILPT